MAFYILLQPSIGLCSGTFYQFLESSIVFYKVLSHSEMFHWLMFWNLLSSLCHRYDFLVCLLEWT